MRTTVVLAVVAFSITIESIVAVQPAGGLPDGVQSVAQGHPMALAMVLVNASVPVGLEVLPSDKLPPSKPDFTIEQKDVSDLAAVVSVFNRSHAQYEAELIEGVVVIRPIARKTTYLDRPIEVGHEAMTGAMLAIRRIFADIVPGGDSPGGILGSRFTGAEEAGAYVTISLVTADTVLDAINEVARQAIQGWLVVRAESPDTEEPQILEVGLIHSGGAISVIPLVPR